MYLFFERKHEHEEKNQKRKTENEFEIQQVCKMSNLSIKRFHIMYFTKYRFMCYLVLLNIQIYLDLTEKSLISA